MATYVYNAQLDAFTLYHISHEESPNRRPSIGPALPALGHAASGAAGTAISKLITYPLDLLITRLQVQNQLKGSERKGYHSLQDAVATIYQDEGGLKAFYSGIGPEVLKSVVDSFLFFLAYTYVRQKRLASKGDSKNLPALDEIGVGMVAGAFSKFWTTPIQNIVTRKQTAAMVFSQNASSSASPDLTTKDIALQIRHEKGLQGFWSGYSASLILTLNPAITFLLHKMLTRLLVPHSRRSDPGARLTFLLAAISKALASTITYPFSLAKTRAQVSSQKPSTPTGPTSETEKPQEMTEEPAPAKARQYTVFSTILRIARTEGIAGLYQGLGAEVLKGFFSHGITMLMKDQIHIFIVNLYYRVLKAMKKYPNPEELTGMASKRAQESYEQGKEQVETAYAKGVEMAGNATESAKDMAKSASQQGKDQIGSAYEKSAEVVGNASQSAKDTAKNAAKWTGETLIKIGEDEK
ncbi:mitochondrial carrier [Delitschia confertaspora ATCC 74209]|uniref:Mitochondrial carrier n=1 Tax=Delitschia confertaspora ATCC 74209 TaxID=1513339 RepID=A0A9P4JP33_9PLEO|nr:mitochondrial carrier [Delitschia confertaspora ATCC 74209]